MTMAPRSLSLFLNLILLLLLLLLSAAAPNAAAPMGAARSTYIVRMDKQQMPAAFAEHRHWYASSLSLARSEHAQLAAASSSGAAILSGAASGAASDTDLLHVYDTVFHGFAAVMSGGEAAALESQAGVIGVIPDTRRHLHTTHSPAFLRLNASWGIWPISKYGSDVTIGVFDTGAWPESRSFSDAGMTAPPRRWRGTCQGGGPAYSGRHGGAAEKAGFTCNRKLVGARYFLRGYEAMSGPVNGSSEFRSPRDSDGHGTHTASTAAGAEVSGADMLGFAPGAARGMAPGARIAVYKVCWASGCFDSDILAAFDLAVADGVDVISLSVGGGVMPYYLDSIALGAFGAMVRGVFVATSGGNQGPGELSVTNVAPWIATVGASTMDRGFPAHVALGDGTRFAGVSLYSGKRHLGKRLIQLIYAGDAAAARNGSSSGSSGADAYSAGLCLAGSLDPAAVNGKIVLCDRGSNARVEKGSVVAAAGGRGMILANSPSDGEGLIADAHLLPAAAVGASAGAVIKAYARRLGRSATARIEFGGTVLGTSPAPVVASFSSRGPNPETPEILKPDVIAPGVNILAAWSAAAGPTGLAADRRRVDFNIISGTSMACPHVSGLAALLKSAHPDWSPAAVKSALMTSAKLLDNRRLVMSDEATGNASTPFDFGSGLVDPEAALDPGLVYDIDEAGYVDFLCALNYSSKAIRMVTRQAGGGRSTCPKPTPRVADLNYPSFSAVFDQSSKRPLVASFRRRVTNVGGATSTYSASIVSPRGVQVSVSPRQLHFDRLGQKLDFTLTVRAARMNVLPGDSETMFGLLSWSDDARSVKSPIAITWQEPY